MTDDVTATCYRETLPFDSPSQAKQCPLCDRFGVAGSDDFCGDCYSVLLGSVLLGRGYGLID